MIKPRVAIVDYGVGNLFSVAQACGHVGLDAVMASDVETIQSSDAVILPGVGAFGYAMSRLHALGLVPALLETAQCGKPLVGICLGFQLLFDRSEEMGKSKGLGLIAGTVRPLENTVVDIECTVRIPNIAWLGITKPKRLDNQNAWKESLLRDIAEGSQMYFVHSYFADTEKPESVLAETSYHGFKYCCATERENVFGCQFHPEKSSGVGLKIYSNLAEKLKS